MLDAFCEQKALPHLLQSVSFEEPFLDFLYGMFSSANRSLRRCFCMPMLRTSSDADANCHVPSSCSSTSALAMRIALPVSPIVE